jgi:DNA invertase Pin-like site-specific DNA recombinase
MTNARLRAVLYARYSSDLQNERSIDDQIALCRLYAEREGYTVAKVYSDKAKSGATLFDRDGLIELISDAKRRLFDIVVVESLDRLSRDQEDLAAVYKRLEFAEVEIRTLNEGKATSVHVGLRGLVGHLFLKDLGAKVRRGHTGRVKEGKIPGKVAYGYRAVVGKPGEREIDPDQAQTIRRIFEEYADGKSPIAIADDLNREGIPGHNGKPWQWPRLTGGPRALLTNRIYLGEIHWNNWRNIRNPDTGKVNKRPTAPEERVVVKVPHLRIISDELFEEAQAVRIARGKKQKIPPKGQRRPWQRNGSLLAGLLRCETCGSSMVRGQGDRGGRPRVICTSAKVGGCNHAKSYDEQMLESVVLNGLHTQLADERLINEFVQAYHSERAVAERAARADLEGTKRRLTEIEAGMMRLVGFLEKGTMAEDIIASRMKDLETERAALTERERLALEATNVVELHPKAIERYRQAIATLQEDLASGRRPESRAAFRNLVDHVLVKPTDKRAPYEVTIFGRLGALLGLDLYPAKRTPREILADQGSSCSVGNDFELSKYE